MSGAACRGVITLGAWVGTRGVNEANDCRRDADSGVRGSPGAQRLGGSCAPQRSFDAVPAPDPALPETGPGSRSSPGRGAPEKRRCSHRLSSPLGQASPARGCRSPSAARGCSRVPSAPVGTTVEVISVPASPNHRPDHVWYKRSLKYLTPVVSANALYLTHDSSFAITWHANINIALLISF